MENVRVVRFNETGPASVLQIVEEPATLPAAGEVRIKVDAIGLNRAEVMFREGAYLETPVFPAKLGYEASGVIDAVGADVSDFEVGDKVSTIPAFSMGTHGVYGEAAIVPAAAVARYPSDLSAEEGTSIWMQYITAYGGLIDVGGLKTGQTALITAASSSVGIAAIQIVKHLGGTVIATTRGSKKTKMLLEAGADHVIETDNDDIQARVAEITGGEGTNVIFDPVGGPMLEVLAEVAAKGARIVEYGALDPNPTPFPLFSALAKGLSIIGYTLFEITTDEVRLAKAKAFVTQGLESGALKPVIDSTFAFEDIQKAHEYMESNQQIGKIVVTL